MKKLIYTQEQVDQVLKLYNEGTSPTDISKQVGFGKMNVRSLIREYGTLRTRGQSIRIGKGIEFLKEDAFNILTPGALYWIGFLYADGSISSKEPYVTLVLSGKDKEHLNKFSEFMGGHLKVHDISKHYQKDRKLKGQVNYDYEYFKIGFNSPQVHSRLRELGFTSSKSIAIIPHELLRYSRDFWRGVVDGDGWVCWTGDKRADGKYNYPCVGLSGTEGTIKGFLDFIRSSGVITEATCKWRRNSKVCEVDIHGTKGREVAELLYKDSTVYLDRKYQKYLEFIQ